jgi:hypothetical protein
MATPLTMQLIRHFNCSGLRLAAMLCGIIFLSSCKHAQKIYKSNCDAEIPFKQVTFNQLINNLEDYDQQYVEVSGKYIEDKELSALFCDSLLADKSAKNGLWVNFSQDCPLYLSGTHQGLFEYSDGNSTPMNNKSVTLRGKIDMHNKGHQHRYKATIDRVSQVKM